jgi:hypothetical protein
MLPPQILVPFFIVPLFPARMVAPGRPKGHRLLAAIGATERRFLYFRVLHHPDRCGRATVTALHLNNVIAVMVRGMGCRWLASASRYAAVALEVCHVTGRPNGT